MKIFAVWSAQMSTSRSEQPPSKELTIAARNVLNAAVNHSTQADYVAVHREVFGELKAAYMAHMGAASEPCPALRECGGAWMIVYDDRDVPAETFSGQGAEEAAKKRFQQISDQWNAHLFARVGVNSRDAQPPGVARPASEWHEDMGDVLWWKFPIDSAPYCGSPLDSHWQEHELDKVFTHWTPLQLPADPTLTKCEGL